MRVLPASFTSYGTVFVCTLIALVCGLELSVAAIAQDAQLASSMGSHPLIMQPLDEAQRTVLKGNTHPLARREFDLGTAPASLPMERMMLVLKRSPEQEAALRKLLDDQQDKASPNYHNWLTPEQYGRQFGPTDDDIQKITAWLQSHGFQVGTTKGRSVLEFSGSASQVQEAFHTTIHKYIVNGEQHWANANDPSIPTALTPAVRGVLTLHNFLKRPLVHWSKSPVAVTLKGDAKRPEVTFSDGTHALGPYDFAKIYNNPAMSNSPNGGGVTIGIIARSDLYSGNGASDVQNFRTQLLPSFSAMNFRTVLNGPDPGDLGGGEEVEVTLDTTWSGAVAPAANVDVVVSASTNSTDGIDLSELYIVENNLADVMSESFGTCEAGYTSTDQAGVSALAEQAAAQGISFFVSTGDSGAEGCDNPNFETSASGPVSVNMLASSAFNVAVGGTIFNEGSTPQTYWNSTNDPNNQSVISYIPEDVWNESCASCSSPNIWAGGGGASVFVPKPAWQSAVTGIPNDNARDLPDVSLTAASHDPYLVCLEGSCLPNSQGQFFIYFVWGTSAAAPSFAGIQALIDQQMAAPGSPTGSLRQGLPNYFLYSIAAQGNASISQCNASGTTLPANSCVFNDVTFGNNAVPGESNYGSSSAQYQAGVGYDLATGLGSVNISNLVNAWIADTTSFHATNTTLTMNGNTIPISISHGSSVAIGGGVSANSGTPTGDVAIIAATGPSGSLTGQTALGQFPLNNGTISGNTSQLPGGSYTVTAHYAGASGLAPSASSPGISVTVTPEPSNTNISVLSVDSLGHPIPFTGGPFGSFVYLRADVAGSSGYGTPTGSVTFTDSFGTIPYNPTTYSLNSQGNAATPFGIYNFDTGTHTISASYSGDASFNPSSGTQSQSFTITPGFFAQIAAGGAQVAVSAPGGRVQDGVNVFYSTGFSGTINLSCSGLPSETTCTFSPASVVASGASSSMTESAIIVATTAPTASLKSPRKSSAVALWVAGFGVLCSVLFGGGRRRSTPVFFLPLLLALVLVGPSCGGGGGGSGSGTTGPPPNPGTPTGAYNITVTATSGSTTSTTGFVLIVR